MVESRRDRPQIRLAADCWPEPQPVVSMRGEEHLNELSRYDVVLHLPREQVQPDELLLGRASLQIQAWTGSEQELQERTIHGIVSSVEVAIESPEVETWHIRLVPSLWRCTLTRTSRIFQDKSVQDIISTVLSEYDDIAFSLELNGGRAGATRPYCVQYQETDYDFIARLAEECGLIFSFEHGDTDTVIFRDQVSKLPDAAPLSTIPWEPVGGASEGANLERVQHVALRAEGIPTKVVLRDYSHAHCSQDLTYEQDVPDGGSGEERLYRPASTPRHDMDSPARDLEAEARLLSEAIAGRGLVYTLTTSCRSLTAGSVLVIDHPTGVKLPLPFDLKEKKLFVTSLSCSSERNTYTAKAQVRPIEAPYRPPRTHTKPVIRGLQTAEVVTGGSDEVMPDELGRIRVRFHWDRDYPASREEESSCWIRVAQSFAGVDHGTFVLPKKGDEVVVAFEEGDPDRPLVVGCVYNAECDLPVDLEGGKQGLRSVFKTTRGFLAFVDDDPDNLLVHLETPDGKHDITLKAGKTIEVTARDDITVKGDKKITVEGAEDITVKGDKPITITGMDDITVQGQGAGTITLKQGAGKITLDSAGNITLEGLRIAIKASADVSIQGAIIKLN